MQKLDLTRQYKNYYTARAKPELTATGPAQFLSITGKGDPSEKMYTEKNPGALCDGVCRKIQLQNAG